MQQQRIIQFNSYLCELIGPNYELKKIYMPFWQCVEGSDVTIDGENWKVNKVIHQIYKVE